MNYLATAILIYACCFAIAKADDPVPTPRGKILDRNGVVLVGNDSDTERSYPFGAAAAHLIGQRKMGIEKAYDEPLARGEDVKLTIDMRVQMVAEMAMRRIGRGAAVITDPSSGEILASVSIPSFDPESFNPRITMENFRAIQEDPNIPLLNRVGNSYPPASVFKAVVALAQPANELEPIRHNCNGLTVIDGEIFNCWKKNGHGKLDLQGAVANSCNFYFYQHGEAVGIEEIARISRLLGLGSRLGLPLQEQSGNIPDLTIFEKRHGRTWRKSDTASAAIGQGFVSATPAQIVGVIGAFATNGTYRKPHLVTDKISEPVDLTTHGIAAGTIDLVRSGFSDNVSVKGVAKIASQELAGCTGTAQWGRHKPQYLAWFAGYTPQKNPRYAICVLVENGHSGRKVAAPLAAMILAECATLPESIKPKQLSPAKGHGERVESIK